MSNEKEHEMVASGYRYQKNVTISEEAACLFATTPGHYEIWSDGCNVRLVPDDKLETLVLKEHGPCERES